MRYLLVDRIVELKAFDYATGLKAVSLSEDCFEHHFREQPVYPGALLVEAMAQLGGALIELSQRDAGDPLPLVQCVLSSVKAKFRDFVRPGDLLSLRADVLSHHRDSALVRAVAKRDDKRVCQAEMVFMCLAIDDPLLEKARREHLAVLTRGTRFIA